nr:reverse transcriptase domain-containing protein [Tanacetum cinerariifolium]
MLKVSPQKGVIRFGKRGKLNPRYFGPFKILDRIGPVAYKLKHPKELSNIHTTFYVSNLKKFLSDESLITSMKELQLDDKLNFLEEPVEVMDWEVKQLKQSRIPIVKGMIVRIKSLIDAVGITATQVFVNTALINFADVVRSGVDSSGLSHDESFGVKDLDLKLNEEPDEPILAEVSIQEPIVVEVSTQEPIVAEVSTQEPIVVEVSTQEPIMAEVSTKVPIMEEVGTQDFSMEHVLIKDYVSFGEDVAHYNGTDDNDDVDEDFLVNEENEIVEPDVDVHLFGISMDLPFNNLGVTNLVPDDVIKGDDMDVISPDGFDSDHGNDDETTYRKREILVKAVQDQLQRELEVQISMSKAFRAKAKAERVIRGDHVLQYSMLRDYGVLENIHFLGALKLGFRACSRDLLGLNGAFMKGPFPSQVLVVLGLDSNNEIYPLAYALVEAESKSSWCCFLQCLGDDIDLHPNLNFTFISDRQKVGRPRKKRKRSKHDDEPFVKDGKVSRKGRTITCQSYGNTRHNKATYKGQGRKATTVIKDVGEDDAFMRMPWLSAINYVNVDGGIVTGCFEDVKEFLKNGNLEKVVAVIKSCTPNALGDLIVTLKDLSSTISGITKCLQRRGLPRRLP